MRRRFSWRVERTVHVPVCLPGVEQVGSKLVKRRAGVVALVVFELGEVSLVAAKLVLLLSLRGIRAKVPPQDLCRNSLPTYKAAELFVLVHLLQVDVECVATRLLVLYMTLFSSPSAAVRKRRTRRFVFPHNVAQVEESGNRVRASGSGPYGWENLPRRRLRADQLRVPASHADGGSTKDGASSHNRVP